ncbi:MAG TPA: hypothetical protein VM406_02915, partial [Noviherbaspirillum sp.]|nr:hypothetical protein [Noviherbaspirillum sp.]
MQMFWNAIRAWLPALCALALAGCGGGDVRLTGDAGQGAAPLVADTFAANLTAEAQIPASTSGGQGAATVTVDPDSRRMVAVLVTSGVVG